MTNLDLLEALCKTPGLPGREQKVSDLIRSHLPTGLEARESNKGDLLVRLPGAGRRVLFLAHLDEVGLIVSRILANGCLRVERLGGFPVHCMPGAELTLHTSGDQISASVATQPTHLMQGRKELFGLNELYVEIGARSAEEVRSMGVRVGDGLTWPARFERIGENRIRGKALDDRLGCFALCQLVEALKTKEHTYDLYFGFTTQEETSTLGAAPLVEMCQPDLVIGIDAGLTFDSADDSNPVCDIRLGNGPCLKYFEAIRGKNSFVPDWETTFRISRFLEKNNLPFQAEASTGLLSAVCTLPSLKEGLRVIAFSIPVRYQHTPTEVADIQDLDLLVKITIELVEQGIL